MNFTPDQQAAIEARENQILVAAAAGSGKTAVLVQRILRLIIDEGQDIDRLLIVTFTEAAAAEMKERIDAALGKLLENDPSNNNLLRQSNRLQAASISTIHAFCRRLVKDHFHLVDLDPSFRVGDQAELKLLQAQVMEQLFEDSYSSDSEFARLVECFGGGKTKDVRLDGLIRRIYEFLQSRPFPEQAAHDYLAAFDMPFESSPWIDIVMEDFRYSLDIALDAINHARELCYAPFGPKKYLPVLDEDEEIIHSLRKQITDSDFEKLYETAWNVNHPRIYTYRGKEKDEIDEELRLKAKAIRDSDVKKRIENARKRLLFTSPNKMREDIQKLRPITESLFALSISYKERYAAEKRTRNLLDFNDLEHFALQILWTESESGRKPSPTANNLAEKYVEILTDEYQDTNEVQEWILKAFTNSENRRFMVGDVKQSIYGFRHAKPKLFTDKLDDTSVRPIILSKNFRSRSEVLDAVNFFFERLMTDYDHRAKLYLGRDFPDGAGFKAELHIAEAHEAIVIADRIKELNRPLNEIVILTRTRAVVGLVEGLKQQGINAVAESTGGFFEAPEVLTAISLLQIVDNPRQDIPLLAVMRLYGFTADDFLRLRAGAEGDFYDCLLAYDDIRATTFLEDLGRWRKKAIVLPISRLMGLIYEETDIMNHFGKLPGGAVRQGNLQLLLEKAIQYEATSFTGLFHFVRYAEWLQNYASDENAALQLPDDESIVRVMTVHQSKGLEFPVVFVSMLGKQFNKQDERAGVVLNPELGLGAMYTDLEQRTRSNNLPRLALSTLAQRDMVAEELRVLYVAMTRAKEKLILTGCVGKLDLKLEKWESRPHLREGICFLDWLVPWVLESEEYVNLHIRHDLSQIELDEDEVDESEEIIEIQKAGRLIKPMKIPEDNLPSKLAISELKRIYAMELSPESETIYEQFEEIDKIEENSIFEAPDFYKAITGQISPMRMGTILHAVVEHMDLHIDVNYSAIKSRIADLAERGLLSQEEAEAVNVTKILRFATSELAERMRNARQLFREIPFVLSLSPDTTEEIYGRRPNEQNAMDKILVHGIIDCYFETDEGDIILVDFKNDAKPETLHDKYAVQMKIYRQAIEQATGKTVAESLFYSFRKDAHI